MPCRDEFPEAMKGELAKRLWYDVNFAYGMEYGYLHALNELKKFLEGRG